MSSDGAVSSFTERSSQVVLFVADTADFCDVGVKNEATALSSVELSKWKHSHVRPLGILLVVVDRTLVRGGGGEMDASLALLFLLPVSVLMVAGL